jgi:hypothetical protein
LTRTSWKWPLYAALLLLALLHNDLWLWEDGRLVLGLPVGLAYHIAFCAVTSVVFLLIVRYAWPADLEAADAEEGER